MRLHAHVSAPFPKLPEPKPLHPRRRSTPKPHSCAGCPIEFVERRRPIPARFGATPFTAPSITSLVHRVPQNIGRNPQQRAHDQREINFVYVIFIEQQRIKPVHARRELFRHSGGGCRTTTRSGIRSARRSRRGRARLFTKASHRFQHARPLGELQRWRPEPASKTGRRKFSK